MSLIEVLSIVLVQLSIGGLLLTALLPPRVIHSSFFSVNSLIGAVASGLALVLTKFVLMEEWVYVRFLGLTVLGATAAYGAYRLEKPELGRILLVLAGIVGLVFGLLPLAGHTLTARGLRTCAPWFFEAGMMAGALLLGATTVAMILGHWYLIMHRLSFVYLQRFAQLLLGAVALRWIVFLATLTMLSRFDPSLAATIINPLWSGHGDLFFFISRVFWGLVLPLVLGIAVLRCVLRRANQAATGLLYVTLICVLFGELFAAYLLL